MSAGTAALLRGAAEWINILGWRQGCADGNDPRLTLHEALTVAAGGYPAKVLFGPELLAFQGARHAVLYTITVGRSNALLSDWNNTAGRTVDDVLKVLEMTAERVEAAGGYW